MEIAGTQVQPSWVVLTLSGILILAGLPGFWVETFEYWLAARLLYGVGVALFLAGR